jgi:excisionase family DNA binding protein
VKPLEKLLTCEQVAERYGVKVITVWEWVREKRLSAVKAGKKYLFRPVDLEKFEDENTTTKEVKE